MPISARLQSVLLSAVVIACAIYLIVRFWPRDYVHELLGQMPANAAVLAYVDVPRLSEAAADASLALPWSGALTANRLNGIAFALAEHEFYLAAGGDFSATLIGALLASQGVHCDASLADAPCAADLGHGAVLLRMARPGTLVASTASSLNFPTSMEFHNDEGRDALSEGSVIWAAIVPPLLNAAMEDPPPEWMNLQIVARALEPASVAYLTVRPLESGDVAVRVEAHCAEADREQLEQVLTGLNDMALALLAQDATVTEQWASTLRSYESSGDSRTVRVQWTLPIERLVELWQRSGLVR